MMQDDVKVCTKCEEIKPLGGFHRNSRGRDGRHTICKVCRLKQLADWWPKHYKETLAFQLTRKAKKRAYDKEIPYDLDAHLINIQERLDKGVCELTGLPLECGVSIPQWNSPSMDRIDSSKGYTFDNIRIICYAMNVALNTWGENTLRILMEAWLNEHNGTTE